MKIVGPEILTYGVADMDAAKRFWTDFGLTLAERLATARLAESHATFAEWLLRITDACPSEP